MTDQLTLLPEDTLVSRSVWPGSEKAKMMTATSGQLCLASSKNTGRLGSLEKTLLVTSPWDSMTCLMTWRAMVTQRGHLLYQLVPSELHIEGIGRGLLPTPDASLGHSPFSPQSMIMKNTTGKRKSGVKIGSSLKWHQFALKFCRSGWINPSLTEWMMGFPIGHTDLKRVETPLSPKSPK